MLKYKIIKSSDDYEYILFLHCICGDSSIFDKQVKELEKRFNILLIDLPYHGENINYEKELDFKNISEEIIKVLDENQIDKVNIIGLSLGAVVTNYICYYYKERVSKVIFLSAADGLKNNFLNKTFNLFCKLLVVLPYKLYIKAFIYCIIPQNYNRQYREQLYFNACKIGKANMNKCIKLLLLNFNNFNKYICEFLNSCDLEKIFVVGNKDYIFKNSVLKKIKENKYNKIILVNKSHMLELNSNFDIKELI